MDLDQATDLCDMTSNLENLNPKLEYSPINTKYKEDSNKSFSTIPVKEVEQLPLKEKLPGSQLRTLMNPLKEKMKKIKQKDVYVANNKENEELLPFFAGCKEESML